jgi:hypothetical protein
VYVKQLLLPAAIGDEMEPTRPRSTALLSLSSDGKPEAATVGFVAPDDGHEDAQNMLSCI